MKGFVQIDGIGKRDVDLPIFADEQFRRADEV